MPSISTISITDFKNSFAQNPENYTKFWKCSSLDRWALYYAADKETKSFVQSVFPSKTSWEFSKKEKCNDIIQQWQI